MTRIAEFICAVPWAFMMGAVSDAQVELPGAAVPIVGGLLSGTVLDNIANAKGQGSGFHPLFYVPYPGKPIFRPEIVGLNFEHVFNGAAADKERSMFTPRKDPCILQALAPNRVALTWPAADSSWDVECAMTYTLADESAIDIEFAITPHTDQYPLGYLVCMWACYMNRTRERAIHFIGTNGEEERWITFGEDTESGFETGTVACAGQPDLPYQTGAQLLNLVEHPQKKFTKPFYYGLIDGDNDLDTSDDTLAYIVMFDRATPIRFALWNFIKDEGGQPDPHSPAWDWQFVVHDPEPGETYRYRMRVAIMPFESQEAIEALYVAWASQIGRIDAKENH